MVALWQGIAIPYGGIPLSLAAGCGRALGMGNGCDKLIQVFEVTYIKRAAFTSSSFLIN
jgi:hypothetical protein